MSTKPIRVLHVLGLMGYGGIETWLVHVLRHIDRTGFEIDILTTGRGKGGYDSIVQDLGSKIIPCPLYDKVWNFDRRLRVILRNGSYEVIHSHHHFFSGYILRVAARAGIPVRIAHLYPTRDWAPQTLWRKSYKFLMRRWINRYGNSIIAVSEASMEAFWGPRWEEDPRRHVLYCGIDTKLFGGDGHRDRFRHELGLPPERPVVLNVSRFVPHKNHVALVEVAESVVSRIPQVLFVLAGDGPTFSEIRNLVSRKGLDSYFHFFQRLPDLVPLWKSADVFVFPSLEEGLGMVVVEAAAAGLPVVASDIPGVREAANACTAVTLVKPGDITGFVDATVGYLQASRRYPPDPLRLARFSIEGSVNSLARIYAEGTARLRTHQAGPISLQRGL